MKFLRLPAFCSLSAALLLTACGGGAPEFTDVGDAMTRAERARVSKDVDTAAAAYAYVLEHAEAAAERQTALIGLYEVQLEGGQSADAQASYARLKSEYGPALDLAMRTRLIIAALDAREVATADLVLEDALAAFPDKQADLAKQVAAVDRLKTEGPDADLSDIGYAGN